MHFIVKPVVKKIWTMDVEKDVRAAVEFSKLLNRKKIRGEFYVCGYLIEKYPKIFKKISKTHIVGAHGYKHEYFGKLSNQKQNETIVKTKEVFEKNGIMLELWRFPSFSFTPSSFHLLVKNNILVDSSLRDTWMTSATIASWINALKNDSRLTFPWPFPLKLKELPWSAVDLAGGSFLENDGRLVLHCYNYKNIKEKIKMVV